MGTENPTIYDYDDEDYGGNYYTDDDGMVQSYEGNETYYPDGTSY